MNLEEFWKTALGIIELQVSKPNFGTWLKNSILLEKNEEMATIGLPNSFAKEWVEKWHHKIVLKTLRDLDKTTKRVNYVVYNGKTKTEFAKISENSVDPATSEHQLEFLELGVDPQTNLNPRYTFQSFAVGKSNEMAYAAARGVTEKIGTAYNPLFISGGVGVGKTHLIQAIGNEIKNKYQNKVKVQYCTSEKFTNDVITGISSKHMNSVKEKYRGVDVLIIDDIQYLANRQATQTEFFNTFEALYQNSKQIILSSDRPPGYIEGLEERLKSRFSGGVLSLIDPPEYELRLAVLKNKVADKKINLSPSIIELIASKVQKNFRELEGVLNRVVFYQNSKNKELAADLIDQLLNDSVQKPSYNVDANQIIKCVANYFDITVADLVGRSRKKELVEPRQITMFILRDVLDLSYPFIGDKLGKRDHTTVIYSCEKVEQEINKNHSLNRKVLLIKDLISKI